MKRYWLAALAFSCLSVGIGFGSLGLVPRHHTLAFQRSTGAVARGRTQLPPDAKTSRRFATRATATKRPTGSTPSPTSVISSTPFVSGPIYYTNQVVALMYHDVQTRRLPGDVITPQTFAQELQLFKQDHYHVVTLSQVTNFLRGRAPIPPNAVLITFDNGYESFYHTVYPMLLKYRDPAVLFAIVRWLSPPYKKGLFRSLDWTQVAKMYRSGLVTVDPQTYNLHHAVQVGPTETSPATVGRIYNPSTKQVESLQAYTQRVLSDLRLARIEVMNHLHEKTVNAMSYPFGDYNPELIHLIHQAGYKYMFTASFGWGILRRTNPATLYRIDAGSPYFTPQGLVETIRQIAADTAHSPAWHAPSRYVQVWHY